MEKTESEYKMIDWWKKVFIRNYANFSGRARRAEYWYFTLANILILLPFYIFIIADIANDAESMPSEISLVFTGLFGIAIFIPSLAVAVRRLHDTNKSGWYYFVCLIPFGSIVLLVWLCTEGDQRSNNYGDDPKKPADPDFDFDSDPV